MRERPISPDDLKALKRDVFNDAVSDSWGLWEIADLARARFPRLAPAEQLSVAEAAVRELLDAGVISALLRGTWVGQEREPVPEPQYETILSDAQSWNASPDPIFWIAADEPADAVTWESILDSL